MASCTTEGPGRQHGRVHHERDDDADEGLQQAHPCELRRGQPRARGDQHDHRGDQRGLSADLVHARQTEPHEADQHHQADGPELVLGDGRERQTDDRADDGAQHRVAGRSHRDAQRDLDGHDRGDRREPWHREVERLGDERRDGGGQRHLERAAQHTSAFGAQPGALPTGRRRAAGAPGQIAPLRCSHWNAAQPGMVGSQKVTVR